MVRISVNKSEYFLERSNLIQSQSDFNRFKTQQTTPNNAHTKKYIFYFTQSFSSAPSVH